MDIRGIRTSILITAAVLVLPVSPSLAQQNTVNTIKSIPCSVITRLWHTLNFDQQTIGVSPDNWGYAEMDALADRVQACDPPGNDRKMALFDIQEIRNTNGKQVEEKRAQQAANRQLLAFRAAQKAKESALEATQKATELSNAAKAATERQAAADANAKQLLAEVNTAIPNLLKHGDLKSQFAEMAKLQRKILTLPPEKQIKPLTKLIVQRDAAEKLRSQALGKAQAKARAAQAETSLLKKQILTAQLAIEVEELPEADSRSLAPIVSELKNSIDRRIQAGSVQKRTSLATTLKTEQAKSHASEQAQAYKLMTPECQAEEKADKNLVSYAKTSRSGDLVKDITMSLVAGDNDTACSKLEALDSLMKETAKTMLLCAQSKPDYAKQQNTLESALAGISLQRGELYKLRPTECR